MLLAPLTDLRSVPRTDPAELHRAGGPGPKGRGILASQSAPRGVPHGRIVAQDRSWTEVVVLSFGASCTNDDAPMQPASPLAAGTNSEMIIGGDLFTQLHERQDGYRIDSPLLPVRRRMVGG
jgi:hypothetical protein